MQLQARGVFGSDAEGRFEIENLPPDTWQVMTFPTGAGGGGGSGGDGDGDDFGAFFKDRKLTMADIRAGEETHGLTVSAFTSVSPDPPLVVVMIDQRHYGHELLERDGATLAIDSLASDQQELSNRFAWVKDEDRFAVGDWTTAETGAPVLADAVAWMDCTIYSRASATEPRRSSRSFAWRASCAPSSWARGLALSAGRR